MVSCAFATASMNSGSGSAPGASLMASNVGFGAQAPARNTTVRRSTLNQMNLFIRSLQPNRERTVVMDLHQHISAELAGLGLNIVAAQQVNETVHQRCGDIGQSGIDKRRPSPLLGIRVE